VFTPDADTRIVLGIRDDHDALRAASAAMSCPTFRNATCVLRYTFGAVARSFRARERSSLTFADIALPAIVRLLRFRPELVDPAGKVDEIAQRQVVHHVRRDVAVVGELEQVPRPPPVKVGVEDLFDDPSGARP
jgi:hypothetical protein